ncbi:putative lipid-binding protein AIR1 [Cicer arietinum]|uniref:14 kDa proline-rich protein DC2.15-like n=1 Tax=Cicer arietinum TaxID=3827 RepID=A0A1S2Y965_CICAR|nr:14 kDa proline-rich protein DC2.15-like [Cicer arietinum]
MASNKFSITILVIFLLAYLTFTEANGSCPPSPKPKPPPPPSPKPCPTPASAPPPVQGSCPKDTLKLGVCADLLRLVKVPVGNPPSGSSCCALIKGLADLEAALCLCTAIKTNVLGNNLNVPVTLTWILSACQKTLPRGFQCA